MRIRTIISALIFISLCAVRFLMPEESAILRSNIVPAINREADLKGDLIAIGKAISGESDYTYVWDRLTTPTEPEPDTSESGFKAQDSASASDEFSLSEMVCKNLIGYEEYAMLPEDAAANASSASPSDTTSEATTETVNPSASEVPVETDSDITSAIASDNGSPLSSDTILESPAPSAEFAVAVSAEQPSIPAPEPLPLEAAVSNSFSSKLDAFLEAQSVFSDYAVPANVSYEVPELPFECFSPCACEVTSGFGYRMHPLDGTVKFHYGTDLGACDGTDVTAFADGTVISVQELDGYGKNVIIEHAGGFSTLYAHCSKILVNRGDKVKAGDKIALSGHSGKVTGPHLHFELIFNGKYLNPEFYL